MYYEGKSVKAEETGGKKLMGGGITMEANSVDLAHKVDRVLPVSTPPPPSPTPDSRLTRKTN